MALRLKYDDIQTIQHEQGRRALLRLERRIKAGGVGIIYATYTAMLELRQHMAALTEVEKYEQTYNHLCICTPKR